MRQAAAAQQAMMQQQPQSTVAEEQMAALGGIGDLPAPNLENLGEGMAGGGIIAFENGGTIRLPKGTSMQEAELVRMQNPDQTVVVEGGGELYDAIGRGFMYSSDVEAQKARAAAKATPPAAAQDAGISSLIQPSAARDQKLLQRQDPSSGGVAQALEVQKSAADADRMSAPPGIASGLDYLKQLETEQARQIAAQAEIDKLRAADVATTRGELSEEEKRAAEFGSEREKRLKAQEEKLAGSEKQNFNMTLIEAGLAMMAGESPNAFKNLAEGAARGLKGYQGRLQTLQDSREKLDESMARLAEIREEKMSAVGARKRELNQQERSIMTESKAAQEKIASAFAGENIKFTKDQADKANARSFEVWKYKQDRADASEKGARSEAQAISVNLRAIVDETNNALRNLTPGEPEYAALASQRDRALAQLAQLSGLKSGSAATSRLKFDARGNPIQ
jgi:hypothetical protein